MISKVWLINLILALCTVLAGTAAYRVWTQEERTDPGAPPDRIAEKAVKPAATSRPNLMMREASYAVIAEKNLFTPDRQEKLTEEPESVKKTASPRVLGRNITLYGVIIMGDSQKALVTNLGRKPDEPANTWVSVGDALDNFTVAAIDSESILLKAGTEEHKVLLFDGKRSRPRPAREAEESTSQPKVVTAESEKQDKKPEKVVKKDDQGKGEFETVSTPFGPVKRKKE
ncbi:MAG: hypothetical protein ACOWYE_05615 [Desulfatiglandales bacterium]